MDPFVDIVKVNVTVTDTAVPGYKLLNGVWADQFNVFPVVGSMVKSPYSSTEFVISLHGTRGDNTVWALRATIDKTTKSGTWTIKNPEDSFANNGVFTKISCDTPFPGFTAPGVQGATCMDEE